MGSIAVHAPQTSRGVEACQVPDPSVETASGKVVLLHGILRSSRSLRRMERALQGVGLRTLNLDYPSRLLPLERLVEEIHAAARGFIGLDDAPVHFVTHSMGGLLARAYITRHRPERLGRVVLVGPPSQGSEVADLLVRLAPYRRVFGPAGTQLTTAAVARLNERLGPVDYPLAVIAGDRSLDPLSWLLIPGANDGRVAVTRTKVAGMAAHLTLHTTHTFMMRNPTVIDETMHFLRHGRFRAGSAESKVEAVLF